MNSQRKLNIWALVGAGILVVMAGYFVFSGQSAKGFGSPVTLRINEQVKFMDGLAVTLAEINDSRCKPGVVCFWAGELSPRFILSGGDIGQSREIRLGTATVKSVVQNGYMVTLRGATEDTATIIVTKEGGV